MTTGEQSRPGVLEVRDVSKAYGAVRALSGVSLTFAPGLTAIVGDNGAGKTTLMKIIAGVHPPASGRLYLDGKQVSFDTPLAARKAGIEALYQDLALANTLSITENIFLGREMTHWAAGLRLLDKRPMQRAAQEVIGDIGIRMPSARTIVRDLSGGQRQAVGLARAIYFNATVLLLDEPTAALGPKETAAFMTLIEGIVNRGATVVMVAHNLTMALGMSTSVAVMRAGRVITQLDSASTTPEELNAFIVGAKDAPGTQSGMVT
jgi:ABC-type sugar transport system ATPase subunit